MKNEKLHTVETPKSILELGGGKEVPMRQIIIETDGNSIHLKKAEVSGSIELIGILQHLIAHFSQKSTPPSKK